MKLNKLISIGLVGLLSLTLYGCGANADAHIVENDGSERFKGIDGKIEIVTDDETGCKYIYVTEGMGDHRTNSLSPLIKSYSSFDCD